MRLAILISFCVLIIAFFVGSLVVYEDWRKDRYDPLIIEAAYQHHLPPALLKAIIAARARFKYYAKGEKGEIGLLQVPQEGVADYKRAIHAPDFDFGWVCINKAHPPHDKTLRQRFPGVCTICRSPLVRGECYPRENIEMGAWYLAKLKSDIEKQIPGSSADPIPLVVAAYCLTERAVRERTDNYRTPVLPPRLRSSIEDILDIYERYKRKGLK